VPDLNDENPLLKTRFSRRDFLQVSKILALNVLLSTLGGWEYLTGVEPSWIEVTRVKLKLPRLARSFSGYKLVQLSDLHLGGWMTKARMDEAVKLTLKLAPDAVVITGDLVMGYRRSLAHTALDDLAAVLAELSRNIPVFVIMGNHDHWALVNEVRATVKQAGAHELNNDVFTLERGNDILHLAGVDDPWSGMDRLDEVLTRLPQNGCAILLAHTPDFADLSAETGRFDLQLSGHSHGGQVVFPFMGAPVLPRMGEKYPSGFYQVGKMFQYTNRGLGMTTPYVRLNCSPEITVFTLESAVPI
jgi:uncharacterized protein